MANDFEDGPTCKELLAHSTGTHDAATCSVCIERKKIADAKEKRTWVRVMPPSHFDIPGCGCGNGDVEWSEFREHLWCAKCQKDFIPSHWGVFDGPVPVHASLLLGLNFDILDLETQQIERQFEKERESLGLPRTEYQRELSQSKGRKESHE